VNIFTVKKPALFYVRSITSNDCYEPHK